DREAEGRPEDARRREVELRRAEALFHDQHRDRHVLADRLPFLEPGRRHDHADARGDGAKPGHRPLPADDHHHEPRRDPGDGEPQTSWSTPGASVGTTVLVSRVRHAAMSPPWPLAVSWRACRASRPRRSRSLPYVSPTSRASLANGVRIAAGSAAARIAVSH